MAETPGTGKSWFLVEITSEHVSVTDEPEFFGITSNTFQAVFPTAGESYGSWFLVDVVSEPVGEEEPVVYDDSGSGTVVASGTAVESYQSPSVGPPPKPIVHPVAPAKKLRRKRYEDRFPADFSVVETAVDRFRADFEVIAGERFAATYGVVESGATTFSAQFNRSLRRRNADEEAVMALLMAEEDWE